MNIRGSRPIAWSCALLIFAACRESAAEAGWRGSVETLPNGVEQVRNPAVGMWGDDDGWSIVEEMRLGSIDSEGPEMFGEVRGVQLDALGRLYVLDAQAKEVRVFDAAGKHVRTFGRQGGGPGEFEEPAALLWGPDENLWVVDQRNSRFSVFDTAGTYLTSHPRPGGFAFLPWPGGFDSAGNLHDVAVSAKPGSPPMVGLARYDRQMEPVDTFARPPFVAETFELRMGNNIMMMGVPFSPQLVWELSPDGDVWLGVNDRYRLHRVNYEGDTLRVVEREFEPLPVTEADRQAGMERLQNFIDRGGTVDVNRIPSTKPAFRGLAIDEQGYLWVRPTAEAGEEDHLFDIFDPEGRYLGKLRSPFPVSPAAPLLMRGNTIVAVTQDELGVGYVVRARIEGR
jgi:hypothetical protein